MSLDDEESAAIARLPEDTRWYFEEGRLPEAQRDAALDAWCTILALEPRIVAPSVWVDSNQELHLEWEQGEDVDSLDVVFEEDGCITWSAFVEELDLSMTNEHGKNPEHGYQLFVGRFRKKAEGAGKHARVCSGALTGTHGFVVGHREEDGHVLLETRDGVKIIPPEQLAR